MTVAVLFARRDSVYKTLPDVDVWDEDRDALKFTGPGPIVAHPPCKRWSSLNNLVLARYPDKAEQFAHGNDGGLFKFALETVRRCSGVLEHPAHSRAWWTFDLPAPAFMVWQKGVCGGWSIEVDQQLFKHPARKRTWLYAFVDAPLYLPHLQSQRHGVNFPTMPPMPTGKVVRVYRVRNADGTWSRIPKSEQNTELSHAAAEHTPIEFAKWLVEVAKKCKA